MRPLRWASALAAVGFFLGTSVVAHAATPGKLPTDTSVRTWTDSTGRFHTKGTLVSSDQSSVRLQKTTGSVITVALARLSVRDQQFVLNSRKASAAPAGADSTPSASTTPSTAWWDGLQANWKSLTKPAIDDAAAMADAGPLILQSTKPMPGNIIYLRLSRQFLERMAWHDVAQQAAVHDTVFGARGDGGFAHHRFHGICVNSQRSIRFGGNSSFRHDDVQHRCRCRFRPSLHQRYHPFRLGQGDAIRWPGDSLGSGGDQRPHFVGDHRDRHVAAGPAGPIGPANRRPSR